jgi:hypothetical protein
LRRHERQDVPSVGKREHRSLSARQVLLDENPLPRCPENAGEGGPDSVLGLLAGARDSDALARGQAVHLDNERVASSRRKRAQVSQGRGFRLEGLEAGRWDACPTHDLLGEDLGALDASSST